MTVVLCLCIHFIFRSGSSCTRVLLVPHVAYLAMSLSEEILRVVLLVVLPDLVHVDVSLSDRVSSQVVGIESVGAGGINVHAGVRFELRACGSTSGFGLVALEFKGSHESVYVASASVLRIRADPVLFGWVVHVGCIFDKDHATLTCEFVFDLCAQGDLVVLEFAVSNVGVGEDSLAGRLRDDVGVFELQFLFFEGGSRVDALQVEGHFEVLFGEGELVGLELDDRRVLLAQVVCRV